MEHRWSTKWIVVGGTFAVVVLPVLIFAAMLIGASGSDEGTHLRATTAPPVPTSNPLDGGRLAALEAGGDTRTMVEQHHTMMDQMRSSATVQMRQLMDSDPMWQMMRSGEFVKLLEEHEENIDRMLARGG